MAVHATLLDHGRWCPVEGLSHSVNPKRFMESRRRSAAPAGRMDGCAGVGPHSGVKGRRNTNGIGRTGSPSSTFDIDPFATWGMTCSNSFTEQPRRGGRPWLEGLHTVPCPFSLTVVYCSRLRPDDLLYILAM